MNTFYGFTLEKELERLSTSGLQESFKNKIEDFITDIKIKDNLSENRLYYYAVRVRKIAESMPNSFLSPTAHELKVVISELSTRKHSNGKPFSENTIEDYKIAMKRFYRWFLSDDKEIPDVVKWIKKKRITNRNVKPEGLITEEEIKKLLQACRNSRDRALFSLMYDSGCRIGEIMSLRLKDVETDNYGTILKVSGKTGFRNVRVVGDSVAYVNEWIGDHPHRNDPEFSLFCGISADTMNRAMTYDDLHSALRKSLARAGIKRRIYPHLFRHTRATILASKVTEAPLEAQMGWVHGSRMTRTYVHLSGRDQDKAILKAYGIEVEDEAPIESNRPTNCPRCKEPNPSESRFCWKCGMILDKTLTEKKLKNEAQLIENSILNSNVIDSSTKSLVKNFDPDFKDKMLEVVLQQILDNPEMAEKFREEFRKK